MKLDAIEVVHEKKHEHKIVILTVPQCNAVVAQLIKEVGLKDLASHFDENSNNIHLHGHKYFGTLFEDTHLYHKKAKKKSTEEQKELPLKDPDDLDEDDEDDDEYDENE